VVLNGNEGSTFGLESGGDIVMLDQRPQSQALLLLLLLLHPGRLASGRPMSVECVEAEHEQRPADYGQLEPERERVLELAQQGQRRARQTLVVRPVSSRRGRREH
jgi:hypothetical protein